MQRRKPYFLGLFAMSITGAAAAQSSVVLFGAIDASVSHYSARSTSWTGASRSSTASTWALSPSGNRATQLGIRATEDLGGGMEAGMWLEGPVANDIGGGLNFGRRSTVSLSGKMGEVRLGRDYTPSFLSDWAYDPFGSNGVGVSAIAVVSSNLAITRALATQTTGDLTDRLLGGGLSAGTDNYLRTGNSIGYYLPAGLGGLNGQVMYAFPENDSKRGRYAGARVGWAEGPTDVALGYGESTLGNAGISAEKIKSLNLGGSYDFGSVKVMGEWSQVRNVRRDADTLAAIGDRYTGFLAGARIPVGTGQVRASVARVLYKNGQGQGNASVNKFALGYVHNLSKRTALYTTVSRISIGNGRNNPDVMALTPLAVSNVDIMPQPPYITTNGMQPRSAVGFDMGLRMTF